jgi:hypothetical protein
MSPAERLAALDDLMLVVEGLGIKPRVEKPVSCNPLRF